MSETPLGLVVAQLRGCYFCFWETVQYELRSAILPERPWLYLQPQSISDQNARKCEAYVGLQDIYVVCRALGWDECVPLNE